MVKKEKNTKLDRMIRRIKRIVTTLILLKMPSFVSRYLPLGPWC